MKKHLFIGFGVSLLATATQAQQDPGIVIPRLPSTLYRFVAPELPTVAAANGLEAITGKPDTFKLQRGRYDVKELLAALAAKTGGKAVFVEGFSAKSLNLYSPLQGTTLELIEKMEAFGFAAGKLGKDWVFVPIKPQAPSSSLVYTPSTPFKFEPRKFDYFKMPGVFPFNSNKVPPGATPFEFNGERVYHVPLQPTRQ